MSEPLSRDEAILQNILGEQNELSSPSSRSEDILLSILNSTEYDKPAESRIEQLLIDLKSSIVHPTGSISITNNGTYNVSQYAEASVSLPDGSLEVY